MKKIIVLLFLILIQVSCKRDNSSKISLYKERGIAIDTVFTPVVGGLKQAVKIKTKDSFNPILLYLMGGPGVSFDEMPDDFFNLLLDKFTLVQWDQRNVGRTQKLNIHDQENSIELIVNDAIGVAEYLKKEFNQDKINIVGSSWGTIIGFDLAQKKPDYIDNLIMVSPVIYQEQSEKYLLETLTDYYEKEKNQQALAELKTVSIPFQNVLDLFFLRKWMTYMEGGEYALGEIFRKGYAPWAEKNFDLMQELMKVNRFRDSNILEVPLYIFIGEDDLQTSATITKEYFDYVDAPDKQLFIYEDTSHGFVSFDNTRIQNEIIKLLLKE